MKTRTGGLAVPETFAPRCPWCATARPDHEQCPRCGDELRCSGCGDVHTRERHAGSCWEVACDLRYLPANVDWQRVLAAYAARGEEIEGRTRSYRPSGPRRVHR